MGPIETASVEVTPGGPSSDTSTRDLVMAWAVDRDTRRPRYIGQIDKDHGGAKCNCNCPSCNLELTAVNAGKSVWENRPHFRHPPGAARKKCAIVAARRALEEMFAEQRQVVLPRRSRSGSVEGLSGKYFTAWVHHPIERVGIVGCSFEDETKAILTLDDGRHLTVSLLGRGQVSRHEDDATLMATIEIRVDDPAIAMMAPEDILARLSLAWSDACWTRHWDDARLEGEAKAQSVQDAASALDWLDADDATEALSPSEQRETLLHREVKAILERERRIRIPELAAAPDWRQANGVVVSRKWSQPAASLVLTSVELEVHLGHSIPDVVVQWAGDDGQSRSMLIEVTVTNRITEERIQRLSTFGLPVLEIDISRLGGVVTRTQFAQLVVDEVEVKRWLYHPRLAEERTRLIKQMQHEESIAVAARRQQRLIKPMESASESERRYAEWGRRYLDAFRRRWEAKQRAAKDGTPDAAALEYIQIEIDRAKAALSAHGYPGADLDTEPLHTIVARILSIKLDTGIEYKFDTGWQVINAILMDQARARHWHYIYLIAVRTYAPALTGHQQSKVDDWEGIVIGSLEKGESAYVRETTFDPLLGVLFPEMKPELAKSLGTPRYEPSYVLPRNDEFTLSHGLDDSPHHASAYGRMFPREEVLLRAGTEAGRGVPPDEFARRFAMKHPQCSAFEIVAFLKLEGVAKSNWEWS